MLSNFGFDLWSGRYDTTVRSCDENNEYPFAGYSNLMNAIYGTIMNKPSSDILDIGFGTAALTSKLYAGGNNITGLDFSEQMLKTAQSKMPNAKLLLWDFNNGIPSEIKNETFDFIVSTYALHHLSDGAKIRFISKLLDLLKPGGVILIGDVCFKTRDDLLACKNSCGEYWDDDEIYFVFSEIKDKLTNRCSLTLHEFSFCAGVIEICK